MTLRKLADAKLALVAAVIPAVAAHAGGIRSRHLREIHPEDIEISVALEELRAADEAGDIPLAVSIELLATLTGKLCRREREDWGPSRRDWTQ